MGLGAFTLLIHLRTRNIIILPECDGYPSGSRGFNHVREPVGRITGTCQACTSIEYSHCTSIASIMVSESLPTSYLLALNTHSKLLPRHNDTARKQHENIT